MFKDTLKNKYNKFGSIDDVVAKIIWYMVGLNKYYENDSI